MFFSVTTHQLGLHWFSGIQLIYVLRHLLTAFILITVEVLSGNSVDIIQCLSQNQLELIVGVVDNTCYDKSE